VSRENRIVYNLTQSQKELLVFLVKEVRDGNLDEEFYLFWALDGDCHISTERSKSFRTYKGITKEGLDALAAEGLIRCNIKYRTDTSDFGGHTSHRQYEDTRLVTLTGKAYEAVDSDFHAPDTSFVRHLMPLSDITSLDSDLKLRCLPMLGAGSADPKLWDSAVRTAGGILEERLRSVGGIADAPHRTRSRERHFRSDRHTRNTLRCGRRRQGYRDLYAGAVGAFRNRFAHRLVDPTPEDGGSYIIFIDLLLKMLEDFRQNKA